VQLTGYDAINYAVRHGADLDKHADPIEEAVERITIERAVDIASVDPGLIWCEVPTADFIGQGRDERELVGIDEACMRAGGRAIHSDDEHLTRYCFSDGSGIIIDRHACRWSVGFTSRLLSATSGCFCRDEHDHGCHHDPGHTDNIQF
jgi:hypothetical protein